MKYSYNDEQIKILFKTHFVTSIEDKISLGYSF